MHVAADFLIPATALAQGAEPEAGVALVSLVLSLRRILNLLMPLLAGVVLLWFFWQMTMLIANAHDPEARKRGRRAMVVSIMVLTVMSSIWGIVAFVQEAFGLRLDRPIEVPAVHPTTGSVPLEPQ